jgi:hypothetical protein
MKAFQIFRYFFRQILTVSLSLLLSWCAFAGSKQVNTSNLEEVKKQWEYLNLLKTQNDKALKKKSKRLLQAIENHFYANSVQFEMDPKNSASLLLKILSPESLKKAHPMNRFATTIYQKYESLRVEVSPLKLKVDQAGALFDDETNRLTLAYDNVIELKMDSFVGHELIHARFYQAERKKIDHVYMGWLKRQDSTPIFDETYPDAFSLDELAAYYYQSITLLHEAIREARAQSLNTVNLSTAKYFVEIGQRLAAPLASDEITQFAMTYLKNPKAHQVSWDQDKTHDIVRIETQRYILELNFSRNSQRNTEELRQLAIARMADLSQRSKLIFQNFTEAQKALENSDGPRALEILSSARDRVLKN